MWVAKIRFSSKGTLIGSKAEQHKVTVFGFPLSYSREGNWIVVQVCGTLFGAERNKKLFVKDLKKQARVIHFELNGDFVIGTIKEPIYTSAVYNKNIIHVAPALISENGFEQITVGAYEKKHLSDLCSVLIKKYNGSLISMQQKKIRSISLMTVNPELTEKQKKAISIAIKHGYYNSPRKIDVLSLAKISKISYATYQVHLRKAEAKLIPFFFN